MTLVSAAPRAALPRPTAPPTKSATAANGQQFSQVSGGCCKLSEVLIGTLEFTFKCVEYLVESLPAILHVPSLRADGLTLARCRVVTPVACCHSPQSDLDGR